MLLTFQPLRKIELVEGFGSVVVDGVMIDDFDMVLIVD